MRTKVVFDDGVVQVTEPDPTPEQQAELDARAAKFAAMTAVKTDPAVRQLVKASPEGIENYINQNVTDLASAKSVLVKLAKAVSVLAQREFG